MAIMVKRLVKKPKVFYDSLVSIAKTSSYSAHTFSHLGNIIGSLGGLAILKSSNVKQAFIYRTQSMIRPRECCI
jgi:hypothetical protein